ncbi:TPA: hypothetical protein RQJ98_004368 [Vibrio vulnificus]|nr:hypothetical protein [Vibrio vulnificus]HDY7544704.1 hypothetical protein [Vibrio vulnificus]HDY7685728.1 hypothetical protein [Vibrio vulnificus]
MTRKDSGAPNALMGVSSVMGDIVTEKYPDYQTSWPCMTGYHGKAFQHDKGVVLLLRNTPRSSIPVVGLAKEARDFKSMPEFEMTYENVDKIINYLNDEFNLTEYDIAVNVFDFLEEWNGDYQRLSDEVWAHLRTQIEKRVDQMYEQLPKRQIVNNKIVTTVGDNNKVLVDSVDNSVNITVNGDIYEELLNCLGTIPDQDTKNELESAIVAMKEHHGTPEFLGKYQDFMGKVANHLTVFGPLIGTLGATLASAMGG